MKTYKIKVGDLMAKGEADLLTGPFGTQLKASEYIEHGNPVINVRNIGFGNLRKEKLDYISDVKKEKLKKHILKTNDIVFGRKGAVDRHVLIPAAQEGWIQGSDCMRLRIFSPEVDVSYLSYYFQTQGHKDWMNALGSFGATMTSLNQDIIKRIEFPAPPLPTQNRIAALLSAYDELIENNRRRIELLEEMARQLYREWFVRMRFPGWRETKMAKGTPEGWVKTTVEKAFKIIGGGTPSKKEKSFWHDGDINWYTPSDITSSKRIFFDSSSLKCTELGMQSSSAKIFPAYSVMITSRATIGAIGINTTKACTNQGFITCIPNKNIPYTYLFFWAQYHKNYFLQLASGATFAEIPKTVFRKIQLLIPPLDIMNDFHAKEDSILKLIEILERKNTLLRQTRDLLLPRLISGQLKVKEAEEEQSSQK